LGRRTRLLETGTQPLRHVSEPRNPFQPQITTIGRCRQYLS
jgi:hypothetical protein